MEELESIEEDVENAANSNEESSYQSRSTKHNHEFAMEREGDKESGHIERIELRNFMCHRRLSIRFGSHVNFVIGRNGSGKSAVLTALIVCLGGKASMTNRAVNLKGFLRAGSSAASILVQLGNRGEDAYLPEVYGNTILIERRINKEGQSQYRLCSHSGKLISQKREELSRILDHFNVQIDNPLTILSQDSARQFLNDSAPQEKYRYFMRGTGLEQILTNYEKIREKKEIVRTVLAQKKQLLPEMKETIQKLDARYTELEKGRQSEQYLIDLKNELAWCLVEEKEKDVEDLHEAAQKSRKKMELVNEQVKLVENEISKIEKGIEQMDRQSHLVAEQVNCVAKKKRDISRVLQSHQEDLREIDGQENEIQRSQRELVKVIDRLQTRISEEKQKMQSFLDTQMEQSMRKIERLETELNRDNAEHSKTKILRDQCEANLNKLDSLLLSMEEKESELAKEMTIYKNRLDNLRSAQQDRLRVFGERVPEVLKEIRSTSTFRYKPIGPIGLHIRLRDQRWKLAIDSVMGAYMESFVVRNFEDQRLLKRILDTHSCTNNIVVLNEDEPYDTQGKEPDETFLTVKRAIECNNYLIMNVLMVQASIERVILISSENEARAIMFKGSPPRNVDSCVTEDAGTLRNVNGSASYFSFIPDPSRRKYFDDVEQQILEVGTELTRKTQERDKLMETHNKQKINGGQLRRELNDIRAELQRQQSSMNDKREELADLKESLKEGPADVVSLEEELGKLNMSLSMFARQIDALNGQRDEINSKYAPVIAQMHEVDSEIEELKRQDLEIQVGSDQSVYISSVIGLFVFTDRPSPLHVFGIL